MSTAPAISLSGQHVLHDALLFEADITLPSGEWTCLLGKSGVGKSTILRLILGLETGGQFEGEFAASDGGDLAERISYMAQSDLLLPWLSLRENTCIGARLRGDVPDMERVSELLARVGLSKQAEQKPATLSGGMRQRAALARTLYEDRPMVFLDEPFSALDAGTRADMQELAWEVLEGRTVLLVTHDPGEAARLAHQILVIADQRTQPWTAPETTPLREINAPETLACQAALLAHIRGGAAA